MIVASAGYRLFAGPTDKAKVTAAAGGVRKPSPSNREARVAWELYLRDTQPAPQPGPSPLAAIWQRDAIFTSGGLSNFAGATRDRAKATGWHVVYVQLANIAAYQDANEAELPAFLAQGWTLVGWGTYGQGTDPEEDGYDAAVTCKRLTVLRGWKANGEAWAEGRDIGKTAAFLKGWTAGGAPVPLGWSVLSSDTANYAREYDYRSALSVTGADVDVQVYGATHPGYTVGAANGMLDKAQVPRDRRAMTFDVNGTGGGPFTDYLTWPGPRRLWHPDTATVQTFDQLAR